jgi:thermitase
MSIDWHKTKKIFIFLFMITIICSPLYFVEASSENSKIKDKKNRFIADEYIIKLKDWGDENSRSQMFDLDTEIQKKNEKMKTIKVKVLEKNRDKFLEKIRKQKNIVWAEPNQIIEVETTPNDPSWGQQWGPQKISANDAWNLEQGNQEVLVVIIDTGICYDHPDISSNYVTGGYDWVNDDPDPMDDHGHGTHCAGIVAATINNAQGIAGLAQVKIMAEKFLSSAGYGSSWDAAQAIIHATDVGKTISNRIILSNSWGSSGGSSTVKEAMEYAYQNGVLITAAAGNDASSSPFYPAAYNEAISVSATDSNDNLASFSNYGNTIEISAPGVSIYSTHLNNGYQSLSGTSMATPHVSGVAALIWSRFSSYNNDLVRIVLQNTADDLGEFGWDQHFGYGRLNAYNAMQGSVPHDIRVAEVNIPPIIFPNQLSKIENIIQNIGTNVESNITIQFIVDNNINSTQTISQIQPGESIALEFDWTPNHIGSYNITIQTLPIIDEDSSINNWISQIASVQDSGEILVVSDDDGAYFNNIGTSKDQIVSTLTRYGYEFNIWIESIYGRPSLDTLNQFRVVIWTCGDYWHWAVDPTDSDTLIQYIDGGGSIILEGGEIGFDHFNDDLMTNIAHATYLVDWVGSSSLTVTSLTHPVSINLPNSFGWESSPGWEDGVAPINNGEEIVEYTNTPYSAVVTSGNGGSKSTVYVCFPIASLQENIRDKIITNSVEWLKQNSHTVKVEYKNPELTDSKFYINKIAYNLPNSIILPEGTYDFAVQPFLTNGDIQYVFDHWENEQGQSISDNLFFTENILDNRTFYVSYREDPPNCLNITVSNIGNITIGQEIELQVTVQNNGSCPINDMLIKLIVPSNLTIKYDESEQLNVASISPGESYELTWHIIPNETGLLRLLVTANGKDVNEYPTVCVLRMTENVSE